MVGRHSAQSRKVANGHAEAGSSQVESLRRAYKDMLYSCGFFDAAAALKKERLQEPSYYTGRIRLLHAWVKDSDAYELEGVRGRG